MRKHKKCNYFISMLKIYHCEKNEIKVFGKGFGEEPFLRKVCPDKSINFYISNTFRLSA